MFSRDLYVNVYSSTIHSSQKVGETQMPTTDAWVNGLWFIHTVEYCLIIRKE